MPETVVYLGSTLPVATAKKIADVHFLPPIKRGDLELLNDEVRTVAIIDGEFYQNLAISPKEILTLLRRGVRVYGASSMGALRAVELYKLGMIGVGEIFRMYRDGVIDADDEVAVCYEASSCEPTSVPLVNIRHTLNVAVKNALLERSKANELLQHVQKLYFPERCYDVLCRLSPSLRQFLFCPPDLKAQDAIELLNLIAASSHIQK